MKMIVTLSPTPMSSLEIQDLEAVSGGGGAPATDSTVQRATPNIEEILRREQIGRQMGTENK